MISTEQKTEFWIIGVLRHLVHTGLLINYRIKGEKEYISSDVDWFALDETFASWADKVILSQEAEKILKNLNPYDKVYVFHQILQFANPHLRYKFMQIAFNFLLNKNGQ